jgi:Zn-dependent peptidase ImmA (M78 family)
MTKPDDSLLPIETANSVKQEAWKILNMANAIGQYPTPVSKIMEAAKIKIAPPHLWNDIEQLRKGVKKNTILSAITKLLGIYDSHSKLIHISPEIHPSKEVFLILHEIAHAHIPWQKEIYSLFEDCEKTLDLDIARQFEKEANVFASEVLFQGDRFKTEALDYEFSINTPITLSKKYGASIYSSIRRFVSTSDSECALLVYNFPEPGSNTTRLRRVILSKKFRLNFTENSLKKFHLNHNIGKSTPIASGMSCPTSIELIDRNRIRHECVIESFDNSYQIFILLFPIKELTKTYFQISRNI